MSSHEKLAFLRGFYEAEGSYNAHGVFFWNDDRELLQLVGQFLKEQGFRAFVRANGRNHYHVRIHGGKPEYERFINLTKPCIKATYRRAQAWKG